jgi:hypothetical protein
MQHRLAQVRPAASIDGVGMLARRPISRTTAHGIAFKKPYRMESHRV